MRRKYLVVLLALFLFSVCNVSALQLGDCKVIASYKLESSLDEENYICKGKEFGKVNDAIYYPGKGDVITLRDFNAYYFTNYDDYDVTLDISGINNISMLHTGLSKLSVKGNGIFNFQQNSFVKKVINSESVYQYVYNGKTILNRDKKIYEGITREFKDDYETLKKVNNLPNKYNLEDYTLVQAIDYSKMMPVVVTESWIKKHINTDMKISVQDGFGTISFLKDEKVEAPKEKKRYPVKSDNVTLLFDKKLSKKYKVEEKNIVDNKLSNNISGIGKILLNLYDIDLYKGNKKVTVKDDDLVIKIKLDDDKLNYQNYQVVYVDDNGKIVEQIDSYIEDGYVVFNATHLSKYGIIATPGEKVKSIEPSKVVVDNASSVSKLSMVVKISILLFFVMGAIFLISFIISKSGLLGDKKRK